MKEMIWHANLCSKYFNSSDEYDRWRPLSEEETIEHASQLLNTPVYIPEIVRKSKYPMTAFAMTSLKPLQMTTKTPQPT